ncbi:MAG: 1-acyl-sn-glycerol-3-phosphate acyltransferase [Deltaproteobacteria bacterium]|nr:1-acyl-sn-glycerol-3-phosphate acyltransferase [Deltaproteobacteria bacterium]
MDEHSRHERIWKGLQVIVRPWLCRAFRLECDPIDVDGPILLIVNHVTAWDPLLVAMALKNKYVYYVASEQLTRIGFAGKLIQWMFAPIPRRKGARSLETVRGILRHLRAGHSVCLFAEGEQSWDGLSIPVVEGTGSLVRSAGVTTVTYRLEGAYLSATRWAKGIRKGKVRGRLVGVYDGETLRQMSTGDNNALLNRDIHEDAWARQKAEPVAYHGKRLAHCLERLLYLCPQCRGVSTLRSSGSTLNGPCGLALRYLPTGFLDPPTAFETLTEWDQWQTEQFHRRSFLHADDDGPLFADGGLTLSVIGGGQEKTLGNGPLIQEKNALACAGRRFELSAIDDMAMTRHNVLLFSVGDAYYQVRAKGAVNLRKYLEIWKDTKDR